ncbi:MULTISPECIES: response regulator [Alteromonas]|jgi:DNA-binding NarL/FixJ family response regulator|uniref:LuxR family transcriptional regulator n=1 Tax=Alteromonas stellipolaris TaxID=233316 RepID=A0ABM5YJ20_9ALTE|nr:MULTISPECIES: response regulator transcription factor [Alteromonas]AMJ90423.1 LuxR family transcriptional regulator [Alteromonas sp. Mac2]ALM91120.1 Transcriptional regulator, LuxR [Alteromonas stellipolaris LMG 21856]AMJ74129.1 LuxR family transcriptional regulator [Alteromonas stellipolaris]AMJ86562.1 LuxR family transcriptional regulator [Alteromonas sp. Mac1]AMJ94264.1 LuxR family transcriptional regulator [Alteromonas stellipolaris]
MKIRVLIADDHPLFRAAMCQALSDIVGPNILQASTLNETLCQLDANPDIDLVFLDVKMPGNDGLIGLSEVRARYPDVLVVMVTAIEEANLIRKALSLGACGFIPKSASIECIAEAVERVLDGEQWLPESAANLTNDETDTDDFSGKLAMLTPHQLKVLRMVADGLLNKQIAYELDISESTVKQHVSAVLRKLNVINRTKAGIAFKHAMAVHE